MREIKFRGWHTEMKRMVSCEEMVADQLTLLPDGRFINVHGKNTKLSTIFSTDRFIPLQYTGLCDKNGKEIYEGDIVIAGNRGTGVVEWFAGGFITRFDARRHELINNHVEVIGNIHENPQLLEN